jgi:hypothetical protein
VGPAGAGPTRAPTAVRPPTDDDGAQALELAMSVPVILLLLGLVLAAGQVALAVLDVHQSAALAARLAATRDDVAVHAAVHAAVPGAVVVLDPASGARRPGDLVTAIVTRRVEVAWLPAPGLEVRADAVVLVEQTEPPGGGGP